MFDLSFNVEGQDAIEKAIEALAKALDITVILDQSAAILLSRIRARYLQERGTDGRKWKKSQAAIDRFRRGRGGGTLFDTGRLFHSIQLSASTPDTRTIGTDVYYGKFHQYGTIKLPRREFLGVSVDDAAFVKTFLIKRISEALNG